MNTTPTELTLKSIESVLLEKEAVLAKEEALLEGLKEVLSRMGYELVPAGTGERRRGGRSRPLGVPSLRPEVSGASEGRRRGRPPKAASGPAPTGETVTA